MKIGDNIYYLDFKDYCVKQGLLYSAQPTTTGYLAYTIINGKPEQKEAVICFDTEAEALEAFEKLSPLAKEIETLAKEAQAKIDALRLQLLGEPTLKELIK
jgi:hypothetical protein